MNTIISNVFPSPCGVLVLKAARNTSTSTFCSTSFRPLAGFWFLKPWRTARMACGSLVSVPLRGSGS